MIKRLLYLVIFLPLFANGQITFNNPSLDGASSAGSAPTGWSQCWGSPDVQPGQWGINTPPTNGSGYVSFLLEGSAPGGYAEGISQQLSSCLTAGQSYTFTMDIAFSSVYNTADPVDCYGSVALWGGNSACGQSQLLWTSGAITTTGWNTVTVTFTPTSNWCYFSIGNYFITPCSGYINAMVDNISPIVPAQPGINITAPTANANVPCSFLVTGTSDSLPSSLVLTGNFTGSPLNATIINANNWQAFVSYPPGVASTQSIVATGVFPSGLIVRDTVTFNMIDITPDFTSTTVCQGSPTQFTDQSTITNPGTIANYLWTFEPGQTSGLQNPGYTFSNAGQYNVKLVVTSNAGCQDSITKQVTVNPGPTADFNLNSGCLGLPAAFQDLSNPNGSVITGRAWDFGDGAGTSIQNNPSYSYSAAGTYNVQLIVTSNSGCTDTVVKPVTISPLPVADFSGTPLIGCTPLNVTFSDLSQANGSIITNYLWDFGDNNTSTSSSPSNIYVNPGIYDVSLIIITQDNCGDTLLRTAYVQANPQATADFIASPYVTDVFDPRISFIDQSTNATTWDWDFGNNTFGNTQNPIVDYPDTGTYVVTLIANNQFNCPDTTQGTVRVEPVPTFYIPSAFTPDNDGVNDYFGGVGADIKNYEMYIYNRWGEQIYVSKDMLQPWNGKHKGSIAMIDTYIYLIRTVNIKNEEHDYHGTVTLVR